MKHVTSTLLCFAITSFCYGQSIQRQSYKKAKIYLNDHRIVKVNNLEINGINTTFLNSINNKHEERSLNTIKLIRVAKGNHLLEGALYGAGTLALTALLIDLEPDALGRPQNKGADFYLGLTAGGAIVGALVGSIFPKWKEVYSGGKLIGLDLPIYLDYDAQFDQITIKITIPL